MLSLACAMSYRGSARNTKSGVMVQVWNDISAQSICSTGHDREVAISVLCELDVSLVALEHLYTGCERVGFFSCREDFLTTTIWNACRRSREWVDAGDVCWSE
jgi:hypothetical protein